MQYNKALRSPRSRAFSWSWVSLVKSILQSVHPERRARAGDAGPERKSKDPENDSIAIQLQGVLCRKFSFCLRLFAAWRRPGRKKHWLKRPDAAWERKY